MSMGEMTPDQEIPELFELLLHQYMKGELGEAGEEPSPAPIESLFDEDSTEEEQHAAAAGINHFIEFCRTFLLEHPPQLHMTSVQGFGVELARAGTVRLIPPTFDEAGGVMEESLDVPVTPGENSGRTLRSNSINVTGK